MEKAEVDIFPHLLLSYNELTPILKRCFSYCAFYPKDYEIHVGSLIKNWMALNFFGPNVGDMKFKGREYFDALAMRSLFQDFKRSESGAILYCKMHDIVHDFALFLKKKSRVETVGTKKGIICRLCDPSHVSMVNEFCTLSFEVPTLSNLCHCLMRLRVFEYRSSESIPQGMENLIHLRRLDLFDMPKLSCDDLKTIFQLYHLQSLSLQGCSIEEIPMEIGNLIQLRFLDLSRNKFRELPMEVGNLILLRDLDIGLNEFLEALPESICDLQDLQTLDNLWCDSLRRIPERLLHKLSEFPVGIGGIKLELLKNSKLLRGSLRLKIRLDSVGNLNEVVQDVWKAELKNEIHITGFEICFKDEMGEEGSSSLSWVWMDIMDALEPHPNLSSLGIMNYGGPKLPRWLVSPLNQLRCLTLFECKILTSLPPLGKLPCLEVIKILEMKALEIVGREFLGMTTREGGGEEVIVFPKLKRLEVQSCEKLTEWEDIAIEEEESTAFSIMPCLTELTIFYCKVLPKLPHRLIRKLSSLKTLDISLSKELHQRYSDKNGSDWKSISINNPGL